MDHNQETLNTWNNIAEVYQEKFMKMDLYNASYDNFCKAIGRPHASILEVGCGPGNITRYLLDSRPDFAILGTDIAPNMIHLARQNNPTARFTVMDAREIGKLAATYDGLIAGFILPYLTDAECTQLLTDAYNLLHERGVLYLSFVPGDPEQSGFKSGSGGRVYFQYHSPEDVSTHLAASGFQQLETFHINYPTPTGTETHTILIARKRARPSR